MKYEKYIGLPYASNGRTEQGIDCWGLVRLFYKNELNIDLPSYTEEYDGPYDDNIARAITTYKDNWELTTTPDIGAVVLFNVYGEPAHVGVYVGNNKFIHSREGKDSVVESLTSPKWSKRFDGFYAYTQESQVEVVGAPHPLKTSIIKEWTVAGTTVADFVKFVQEKYKISERLATKLVVMVDGIAIPKDKWNTTVLEQGQKVAYKAVPEGREALRLILIIAVVYLAVNGVATPEFASVFGTSAGAKAVGVMVLSQAGMALVNAILPIRPITQNDPGSPTGVNLFTGTSNQANKFGSIPVVLGKVRMTGMLGATPYVETLTDTSILNMLLVWGFGPLEVTDICVGTNSIVNYYEGFPQDIPQPITLKGLPTEDVTAFDKLYPQDVEQKFPQIELVNNTQDGNPSAEVALANPCTAIDVAFTFPEGMRQIVTQGSGSGNVNTATAVIEIMMRKAGTSTWENVVPYAVGNYNSATPNAEAFTCTLTPCYYTTTTYDYENSVGSTNINLYRWTVFALGPNGIAQFDGTATDRKDFEPSTQLLAEYRAGNYKNLVSTSNTGFTRLPTIPPGYLKLHTVCVYGSQGIVENISHLSSYSSVQGLTLTVTTVLETKIDSEQYSTNADLGSRKIAIAAGKIDQQAAGQAQAGVPQVIFTSRQFPSVIAKDHNAWGPSGSIMHTQAVWNAGDTGETFDHTTSVTFPYSGYYTVEASSDDEGYLAINGRKVIDVPKGGYNSTLKNLYYTEAGTYTVRQYATNSGGGAKGAACSISYTANSGLNTPATPNTELSFGAEGFFNKRKDAFNFVYRVRGLERALYEIKVRRVNSSEADPSDSLHNYHKAILYNVTGYDNTKPMKNPPNTYLARTALRIQSTNKANGTVDGVNALVQTIGYDWDRSTQTWVIRPINNPASLFVHVLMHPANAYRIKPEEASKFIDLKSIQEWHEFCDPVSGGVRLTYNNIISNTSSVMDVLRDIAAAGKASPSFVDGKWSIVVDKPRNTTVQHFTPHNSWGFEGTKILPRIPDAFRITIPDESKAYQPNELIVYSYGKNATNAEVFESLNLPGVTNADQAVHLARWHMAQLKLRPETYTLNADFEYLVCTRGDVVKVTHDVPLWGTGSGRIKTVTGTNITLTEDVYLATGKNYSILVRKNNGSSTTMYLAPITESGYTNEIVVTATTADTGIEEDNLFMLGEVNKETQQLVVLSVEPNDATSARLTLADYSPQIYTADLSGLLVYNTNITGISTPVIQNTIYSSPIITRATSDSAISEEISNGTYQNVLLIGFSHPGDLSNNAKRIHVQVIPSDVIFDDTTPQGNYYIEKDQASLTVTGLRTNQVYKLRARYTNTSGSIVGPWSDTYFTNNLGKSQNTYTVGTLVLDLDGTFITAAPTVDINKPADFKTYEYRLYKDTGTEDFWELDPATNSILVTQSRTTGRFNLLDMPHPRISTEGVTYRVACRALDNTNVYSAESSLGTIVIKTIQ